jgi:hypothetical protein
MQQRESKWIRRTARRLPGLLLASLAATAAAGWGQENATPAAPAPPAAEAEAAPAETSLLGRVTIHGFLTQAYGFSNGNQILGIPHEGTFDYGNSALQIRGEMTAADSITIQLGHERNADSPSQKTLPDVSLDWVFYEHRFGESTLKVGRVKVPLGVYNEARDVGTILPFFRPPRDFYGQGAYTLETIDGGLVSHHFSLAKGWDLTADAYFGNWELFDTQQQAIKATKTVGTQLFLETPVDGLRFGLGGVKFNTSSTPELPRSHWQEVHGSLQATFGRFEGEIEAKNETADLETGARELTIKAAYVRLGVHLTSQLTVNGQLEGFRLALPTLPKALDYDRDEVLGLSYQFHPDLVLKAEYHWNTGYSLDTPVSILGPKAKTQYGLVSLAASF